MHAKFRDGLANLYRSHYVRKGMENNNTHGFSKQKFVGSLPADSLSIPPELVEKLTDAERSYVERKVIEPARQAAEARRLAELARERDANWRVVEAARLLREARDLAEAGPGVLDAAGTAGAEEALGSLRAVVQHSVADCSADPLQQALEAIQYAARAVREGRYGKAPSGNVRATDEYQLWGAIKSAVDGDPGECLLRALQDVGFVKVRGR
ncbi:hypothetical protein BJN34_21620 [Cupriavidus necator]|uniref:Uncharacterized protein n=1 Tax=Cupriavidus necator TaxID=106590 RepID=A0A1U9UUY6_CUPNE|nr:hypothetical protein [Cupriavidus necator]AQV96470.1 hypothetical protein BJN34_21620 [Cupriavidus necator]